VDTATNALLKTVNRHREGATPIDLADVYALVFSPDGTSLFAGSGDGVLRRWNTDTGAQIGRDAPAQRAHLSTGPDPGREASGQCQS
jgi:WD40 repeat protein